MATLDPSIIMSGASVTDQMLGAQRVRGTALELQGMQQDLQTGRQAQMEANAGKLARMVLSSPNPAADYPRALQAAQMMGIPIQGMPQQWTPEVGEQLMMMASLFEMPPDERTEFERMISALPPGEQMHAIRVKAGLEPGADAVLRGQMGDTPPSAVQEYEFAKQQGYTGTFQDWKQRDSRAPGDIFNVSASPDGGMSVYSGPADGVPDSGRPVGRAGQNQLDAMEINAREQLARIQRIEQSAADPVLADFGSVEQRLRTWGLGWQDFLDSDSLTPEQADYLDKVTTLRGDLLENVNYTIKEITGAAMSIPEAERILSTLPSPQDSPRMFRTKLDRVISKTRAAVARYNMWRNQGFGGRPESLGSLVDVERQMEKRRKDLWQAVESGEMTDEEAAGIFASEFGV